MTPYIAAGLYSKDLKRFKFRSNNKITGTVKEEIILEVVSRHFKLDKFDILSKVRKRIFTEPRHIVIYFIKAYTTLSLKEIGRFMNRDHASVIYAIDTCNNLSETNPAFREKMLSVQLEIDLSI